MEDELSGKSRNYIEDRLQSEFDGYEEACAKHGFKVISGALTTIIDSKSVLAASSTTLAAVLAGAPLSVVVGAPLLLELTNLTVSVANNLYDLRKTKKLHPMSYIMHARESLAP